MITVEALNQRSHATLPGLIGLEIVSVEVGLLNSRLVIRPELLAPNGFLHAGTVVTLADTSCGYGTIANLPEGAQNFATIELKTNFLGTAREGTLECTARLVHGGRTTQVWDAEVHDATAQKVIALFRCTQMILYPRF